MVAFTRGASARGATPLEDEEEPAVEADADEEELVASGRSLGTEASCVDRACAEDAGTEITFPDGRRSSQLPVAVISGTATEGLDATLEKTMLEELKVRRKGRREKRKMLGSCPSSRQSGELLTPSRRPRPVRFEQSETRKTRWTPSFPQ